MHKKFALMGCGLIAAPAVAGQMNLSVEVPRLKVAEYHRPYVAIWLENGAGKVAANLSVWYDLDNREEGGTKWLAELRTWWRRAGRSMHLPVDGLTGPTRPPATQKLSFREGAGRLPQLPPGQYRLMVEAAREVGGREILSIPVQWPPTGTKRMTAQGKTELGAVTLTITP